MLIAQDQLPLFCENLSKYKRFKTREVLIGDTPVGADNPIRIQSMTNTDTMDTLATVEQVVRMVRAGCEYVRITAPSIKAAENLANIKKELAKRGCNVPIIADVHFNPKVAEVAAAIVEKIRVNPGNFSDQNTGKTEFTDSEYQTGIDNIKKNIAPLIEICKQHGTVMRIGVNHGSLSERIVSRFGNTPRGMVESALEFIRICEDLEYHNIVLSMKSSNPVIMVHSYRMLVGAMKKYGYDYPLHLGVTEAGEGIEGRVRSAVGIGALLEDGIGDTIRVSLTENPECEIPVAKTIVNRYEEREEHEEIPIIDKLYYSPYEYHKRTTYAIRNIGGNQVPIVVADYSNKNIIRDEDIVSLGYKKTEQGWLRTKQTADFIYLGTKKMDYDFPHDLGIITCSRSYEGNGNIFPLYRWEQYSRMTKKENKLTFVALNTTKITDKMAQKLKKETNAVLILKTNNKHGMADIRRAMNCLIKNECETPVIFQFNYWLERLDTFALDSATDTGALLIDGLGDGVFINFKSKIQNKAEDVLHIAFTILQATRTRISQTEYISCPTCGRTTFNIQETVKEVKKVATNLNGIKIAIMGCVVNGPGEMAGADYGYVGAGKNKINLYYKGDVIKKNVPEELAVNELVLLIKEKGDWKEYAN